jgi:hypothetical protein
MIDLLGLTLSKALEAIKAEGLPLPRIEYIQPEKHPEGTEHVVRVHPGELLIARFPDRVAT